LAVTKAIAGLPTRLTIFGKIPAALTKTFGSEFVTLTAMSIAWKMPSGMILP
jgi:hypothetical protein